MALLYRYPLGVALWTLVTIIVVLCELTGWGQ
jgi:hypothetical protein